MQSKIIYKNSTIFCEGDWSKKSVTALYKSFRNIAFSSSLKVIIDLSNISFMDTAGAMLVLKIGSILEKKGMKATFVGADKKIDEIIKLCKKNKTAPPLVVKEEFFVGKIFSNIGKSAFLSLQTLLSFFSFIGGTTKGIMKIFLNPASWRFNATLYHMEKNGLNALGIVTLTSILIGVVIAFQGAVQLEKFGANIFIVEMVGISSTRELAPLIVAIVIAGRSASAYTAQLGVMKITEEVDAMRTLGFDPWEFLIVPRTVALILVLPLLVIFADVVSVFGGMLVAKSQLGVNFYEFIARFKETVGLKNVIIGLVKAPFFGWIIATIGCFRGFQITSSTESVGKYTTISVVNAIFWVIAFDAVASIFLTKLDL